MIRGKIVREYGGPESLTPSLIESSLSRMKRYVDTIDAVLAAEYPDFDLVGSFFVFKLEGQIQSGGRHAAWQEGRQMLYRTVHRTAGNSIPCLCTHITMSASSFVVLGEGNIQAERLHRAGSYQKSMATTQRAFGAYE